MFLCKRSHGMKNLSFFFLIISFLFISSVHASWWNTIFSSVDMPTVTQDDGTITVSMKVEGNIDPDNIVIDIKDQTLCVYGSMNIKNETNEEGFYRKEVSSSSFNRCTSLPCEVYEEDVIAELSGSTLTIRLKKKQNSVRQNKKIKVVRV
jgi:HSP20 family molecular chaperone IbpA